MKKDLVDYLAETRDLGGSDLHIAVDAAPAARVRGNLVALEDHNLTGEQCRQLIFSILTEKQRAVLEEEWELDFALEVDEIGRFRGNAFYVRGNVEVAFRYILEDIPDLEELGHATRVNNFCDEIQGLVLVTGKTGCGKTTTLASMIKRISERRSCIITTVEDPIEYVFTHKYGLIRQRQVGSDTYSFAKALRSVLRQDPDVIVVSEMRDLETIQTAITAAETGHLVIGTVHTIDAPKTFERLIDVFPADQQAQISTQIANVLVGVVSQRLLQRADNTGLVLASEILTATSAVRTCILDKKFWQLIGVMEISKNQGMRTIDDHLTHLLREGEISIEDALANCRDREMMYAFYEKMLEAVAEEEEEEA